MANPDVTYAGTLYGQKYSLVFPNAKGLNHTFRVRVGRFDKTIPYPSGRIYKRIYILGTTYINTGFMGLTRTAQVWYCEVTLVTAPRSYLTVSLYVMQSNRRIAYTAPIIKYV